MGSVSDLSETQSDSAARRICKGCGEAICDRYLFQALDHYWHEDCLKCACCECRLGEVGSKLYTKANLILCQRDYLRLFGKSGSCSVCHKVIPAYELAMKAGDRAYHLDCFACQYCHRRFCVGDKYNLCNSMILCQKCVRDYGVFMNEMYNRGPYTNGYYNNTTPQV